MTKRMRYSVAINAYGQRGEHIETVALARDKDHAERILRESPWIRDNRPEQTIRIEKIGSGEPA